MATYFDVEPLSLSGHGEDHPFDFSLDDSARGETTETFKSLFGIGGDDFDKMFLDESTRSLSASASAQQLDVTMCLETGQQQEQPRELNPCPSFKANANFREGSRGGHKAGSRNRKTNPRRRTSEPAPTPLDHQFLMMNDNVDFNPAPTPYNPENNPEKSNDDGSNKRKSCSDLAMFDDMSFDPNFDFDIMSAQPQRPQPKQRRATLDSAITPSLAEILGHAPDIQSQSQPCENTSHYHEALQKLAQSMKRTELSRRQVIMQRTLGQHGQQAQATQQQRGVIQRKQKEQQQAKQNQREMQQLIMERTALLEATLLKAAQRQEDQQEMRQVQQQQAQQQEARSTSAIQQLQQRMATNEQQRPPSAIQQLQQRMSTNAIIVPTVAGSNAGSALPRTVSRVPSSSSISSGSHLVPSHSPTQEDRSSIMAAFFSGSRNTLTEGLQESRKQMKVYAEIMGKRTTTNWESCTRL